MGDIPVDDSLPKFRDYKATASEMAVKAKKADPPKALVERGVQSLLELPSLKDIRAKLCSGWELRQVAEYVHSRGDLLSLSVRSLIKALATYKDTIPRHLFVTTNDALVHEAQKSVVEGIEVLAELQDLYKLQRERIAIDWNIEKNLRKLTPDMHKELRLATDMLQRYAQIQMDFGLTERQLGNVTVEAVSAPGMSSDAQKVLSSPKSRHKLLELTQVAVQLKEMAAKAAKEAAEEEEESK